MSTMKMNDEESNVLSTTADRSTSSKDPILGAFAILPTRNLEEISVEEALQKCEHDAPAGTPIWIDTVIHVHHADEKLGELQSTVLSKLRLPPFLRRNLKQVRQLQTPQVVPLSKACMLVIRILSPESNDVRHASAICLHDKLVTITTMANIQMKLSRRHPLLVPGKDVLAGSLCERELVEASVTGGVVLWLSFHLGQTAAATNALRKEIFDVTEQMDADVASITLEIILELKDRFLLILAVAEEQNGCVERLADVDLITDGVDFKGLKGSLGLLVSTAGSTERMIFRLEKRLQDLRLAYESHQQERINHRLNALTILSAVFLPLTLMAGIWGMNFENMPELEKENAYYYALGAMAVVALSFLTGFYWNGWLS